MNADWTVSWFTATVRENKAGNCVKYMIGRDVEPSKYMKFQYETKLGDIYKDNCIKVVIIKKNIQFRWQKNKPNGKEMCVGVLEGNIPEELLNLTVDHMSPSGCGRSDDMHGYRFECYVDFWSGIPGENEQMSFDGFPEVMP